MNSRLITSDEYISLTRGLHRYNSPQNGQLTHHNQDLKSRGMEVSFATSISRFLKISHLRVNTKYSKVTLEKPVNLILGNDKKKELYRILKELADLK